MGFVEVIHFLADFLLVFFVALGLVCSLVLAMKEAFDAVFSKNKEEAENEASEIECACAYCPAKARETADLTAKIEKTENNS